MQRKKSLKMKKAMRSNVFDDYGEEMEEEMEEQQEEQLEEDATPENH